MDIGSIATLVVTGVAGLGLGHTLRGATVRNLRESVAARDEAIADHQERILDLSKQIGTANRENDVLARKHGQATAEIARLKPLAERAEKAIASQTKAARAGGAALAAKRAESRGVTAAKPAPAKVTAPKKPYPKKKAKA
jgi:hypothetical protein